MKKFDRLNTIRNIILEIDKIYYEIMDADEISYYRNMLLAEKLNLIYQKLELETTLYTQKSSEAHNKIKKLEKLMILLSLSLLALTFLLPIELLILLAVCYMSLQVKVFSKIEELRGDTISLEESEEIEIISKNVAIVLSNINTFSEAKYRKSIVNMASKSEHYIDEIEYNTAVSLLEFYLHTDMPILVSHNIEYIIVNILKNDLNTSVNDIQELINLAKLRMKEESKEQTLSLNREK